MKELNDDELQQWLESPKGIPSAASDDVKAYSTLFDLLKAGPEGGLPFDFSAKVTRLVATQQKRKNELKYNLVAAVIFIALLICAWYSIKIYNLALSIDLLPYKWVLLLAPLVFITIQYLDQQLVKRKLFRGL